jgi:predicted nucleic acid-binding protein
MIAFDTNLLVRALVADNPDQVAVVRQLITADTIFIPRTVLLETEWVLRSRYKKTRAELNEFFTALLEWRFEQMATNVNVRIDNPVGIRHGALRRAWNISTPTRCGFSDGAGQSDVEATAS